MAKRQRRRAKAAMKRRGYEFSGYQAPDGDNFKLVANTARTALFQAREGNVTVEYHYDKETGKKITRRLENPFV